MHVFNLKKRSKLVAKATAIYYIRTIKFKHIVIIK